MDLGSRFLRQMGAHTPSLIPQPNRGAPQLDCPNLRGWRVSTPAHCDAVRCGSLSVATLPESGRAAGLRLNSGSIVLGNPDLLQWVNGLRGLPVGSSGCDSIGRFLATYSVCGGSCHAQGRDSVDLGTSCRRMDGPACELPRTVSGLRVATPSTARIASARLIFLRNQ